MRSCAGLSFLKKNIMDALRVVTKCDNPLLADEMKAALEREGIGCMVVEEVLSADGYGYGVMPGTAVKVLEKDYERACKVASGVEAQRMLETPWCPRCGSGDVTRFTLRRGRLTTRQRLRYLLLSVACFTVFLLLFNVVYRDFVKTIIMATAASCFTLLAYVRWHHWFKVNRHCEHCGYEFYRK